MTQKKAASNEESSLNNSQPKYNTHVTHLGNLITKQLEVTGKPILFSVLVEQMKTVGFTRTEITGQLDKLVAQGVILYREGLNIHNPLRTLTELRVVLLEVPK